MRGCFVSPMRQLVPAPGQFAPRSRKSGTMIGHTAVQAHRRRNDSLERNRSHPRVRRGDVQRVGPAGLLVAAKRYARATPCTLLERQPDSVWMMMVTIDYVHRG